MGDTVIQVENLWKEYRLGVINHHSLTRDLQSWWARRRGKEDPNLPVGAPHAAASTDAGRRGDTFWALRELSFEVKQGQIIGIIGRNGAGKSTLLKILSQVTAPSRGEIRFKGRIASLLEVGTGFHPELTGRENIFLNGAILGMSRGDIRQKLDEIIAFAEIGRFVDTPVKRYSSGMYVRLAFAVAAHLEPEILIIDEVLAVGDLGFQKKCLGKMEAVGKEGRTVLFVSHNMAAVANLCHAGIVLSHGAKVFQGEVAQAISRYLESFAAEASGTPAQRTDRQGRGNIRITQVAIKDRNGSSQVPFPIGSELSFEIDYRGGNELRNPRVIIGLYDNMGVGITRFDSEVSGNLPSLLPGTGSIACSTGEMNLTPGRYFVNIAFFSCGEMEDYLVNATFLDIAASDFFNTGKNFDERDRTLTKFLVRHDWRVSV
jgi:lipopolysaccharide transport system ATP-binding protein